MANPSMYCLAWTNNCALMSEWAVFWQAFGVIVTLIIGVVGLKKIFVELQRIEDQKNKENLSISTAAQLKRTEFFLSQHRRLFDDKDLYEILCLIDSDDANLSTIGMSDKKRKFLTFFEEIALLVKCNQINEQVAYYMFGYYSICCTRGKNFSAGINQSPEHWGLLYWFADNADKYLKENTDGPPASLSL